MVLFALAKHFIKSYDPESFQDDTPAERKKRALKVIKM